MKSKKLSPKSSKQHAVKDRKCKPRGSLSSNIKKVTSQVTKIKWAWFPKFTKAEWLEVGSIYPPGKYNPRCVECGLWKTASTPGMKPDGSGPLHIVMTPTVEDDERWHRIGSGRLGRLLKKYVLGPVGLGPSDVTIVSAIKCRPPTGSVLKRHHTLCAPFVTKDLSGADQILTLGADALSAVNLVKNHSVTESAGLVVPTTTGIPVMISLSPAMALVVKKSSDSEQANNWGTLEMIRGHIKQLLSGTTKELPKMKVLK